MTTCPHPKDEPGRKKCRDCRRRPGRLRSSRTVARGRSGPRAPVYMSLTEAEWVAIHTRQEGRCAICRTGLCNRYEPGSAGAVAGTDHLHSLEKWLVAGGVDARSALRASIRGLLCGFCNRNVVGIALRDDAAKARRAVVYLENPPARAIVAYETSEWRLAA